jgi:hypothetical protein
MRFAPIERRHGGKNHPPPTRCDQIETAQNRKWLPPDLGASVVAAGWLLPANPLVEVTHYKVRSD